MRCLDILKNTFVHIPGVGASTEANFWNRNIKDWYSFLDNHESLNLSEGKKELIIHHLNKSIEAKNKKNHKFFFNHLPSNLHWRAYEDFKDKCCFLDIETTGLDKHHDDITVIGLYDGKGSKFFINGKNLDEFEKEIRKYSMIVSFNGRCFDVPFIKAKFPNLDLDKLHIDLRFTMQKIGYSGGLKRIEKELEIKRDDNLEDIDGFEAVRLWYKYKKGDQSALDLLIKYNKADIENLKYLMEFSFSKLKHLGL